MHIEFTHPSMAHISIDRSNGREVITTRRDVPESIIYDLAQGIKSQWYPYTPKSGVMEMESKKGMFFLDSLDDPRYIAKFRIGADHIQRTRSLQIFESDAALSVSNSNSILNECIVAERLSYAVAESNDLQDLVRSMGFIDLSIVAPIAGSIDQIRQEKCLVYPWIPNANDLFSTIEDLESFFRFSQVAAQLASPLYAVARNAGVRAITDFGSMQLLMQATVNGTSLYIVDTTRYIRSV